MLLGRPWIHTSGAAPSSLHQRVKYAVEGHVVTVKKKLCLSLNLLHSRILKPLKKLLRLPSSHSKFGMLILFLRVPLCPKMSEASKMVARFMLNSPYQKGKGQELATNIRPSGTPFCWWEIRARIWAQERRQRENHSGKKREAIGPSRGEGNPNTSYICKQ